MSSTQLSSVPEWVHRPPGFSCVAYAEGVGVVRVTLTGELDMGTAPQLAHALAGIADPTALVILDLSELTFMDSCGLHVILNARAALADAGRGLALVPGCHQVQRIFELTGTEHRLEFVSTHGASQPRPGPVELGATSPGELGSIGGSRDHAA